MLYSRVVSAAEGLYVLGFFFTVFRNVFSVWPQKISLASLTIAHCWIMPSVNSFSQEGSLKREPWVCLFFFLRLTLSVAEVHVRMLVISLSLSLSVDVNLSVLLVVIWHSPRWSRRGCLSGEMLARKKERSSSGAAVHIYVYLWPWLMPSSIQQHLCDGAGQ